MPLKKVVITSDSSLQLAVMLSVATAIGQLGALRAEPRYVSAG